MLDKESLQYLATRQEQIGEGVKRLRTLRVMACVVRNFKKKNRTLYYSERMNNFSDGILYWTTNDEKIQKAIEVFEERTGNLVYHAQLSYTTEGRWLSLLYVENDKQSWPSSNLELQQCQAFTYVVNIDQDITKGDLGYIGVAPCNGGVSRTF